MTWAIFALQLLTYMVLRDMADSWDGWRKISFWNSAKVILAHCALLYEVMK